MRHDLHHDWAPVPPMGWNSWDAYGASVTEDEVTGNAEYMARHLKPFGWEYLVVDIQWYEPGATSSWYRKYVPLEMDAWSRLMPAVNRFPSAVGGKGFKPLADRIHSLGLKFGIHLMRGIPRQAAHAGTPVLGTDATARVIAHTDSVCPWNTDMYGVDPAHPGSRAYYESLFALYAEWGVDFVKIDDLAASRRYPDHLAEMELIHQALLSCGRPMVLSVSPGPASLDHGSRLQAWTNMWRITDDFWDGWDRLKDMFDRCRKWFPFTGPGHWPDCDMLPLGRIGIRNHDGGAGDRQTRFTPVEQRTMVSLWAIVRSPLMLGGELRDTDPATLALLTNPGILEVHREGSHPREVLRQGDCILWESSGASGVRYLGLFNTGDQDADFKVDVAVLGLGGTVAARDLWEAETLPDMQAGTPAVFPMAAHGCRMLALFPGD